MSLMWIPAHTTTPPFATARSAAGTSAPIGAKMMAALSGSCEGEHPPPLKPRHLRHEVRRRSEPVDAQALTIARGDEGPVSDQPGTQQRCRLEVTVLVRNRNAEPLVGDGQLGIATVQLVTGEAGAIAQVLLAVAAIAALAAGPAEPRDSHASANGEPLRPG